MDEVDKMQRTPLISPVKIVLSDIPSRLDRLPWSKWHTYIVTALGITWLLDGLEVTLIGVLGALLQRSDTLGLSGFEVGLTGTTYIAGAVVGSIVFGVYSDRVGRKKLYMVTPAIYLTATFLCGFAVNFPMLAALRFLTGFGIGGEYSAINSVIQELIPARVRGTTSLLINGSFWLGAALGGGLSLVLLNPSILPVWLGWRLSFGMGAVFGIAIIIARRHLPESPRWLMRNDRIHEAELILESIEKQVYGDNVPSDGLSHVEVHQRGVVTILEILHTLFLVYPKRSFLGLTLMLSQAFFYNAVFLTYATVLHVFYDVDEDKVGIYLIPFCLGNFLGPVILGPLFDRLGRKVMISFTYFISGALLVVSGLLFLNGYLTSITQTLLWAVVFFFSSSAASSAYLTVSEIFPFEIRALAIAVFYSIGTGVGGITGPTLFGALLDESEADHDPSHLFVGYCIGGGLMIGAAIVEVLLGVSAERKSLEDVAGSMDDPTDISAHVMVVPPESQSIKILS